MDSHSRSASPREPARPQHRPPSPPASPQAGFDNRAYQHDESDPNHNDSFTSNGAHQNHQNGHTKEPNGDTKTLEAVNLELINLTPKNGSKKKDVEVDMNAANPYDEYFVPVNEHRKYMRGEKLYVTADKRGEKGGCKRPLCWTLLALVVVAIVALIVLAATGILFTNSPTPLEQYNASVSSARAFGGITSDQNRHHDHEHGDHHHDNSDHDHNHGQEHNTSPPQYGTDTQSDEAQIPMTSEETGDTSMYVPRTLEGTLKIDNEIFTPDFENTESEKYKDFTMTFSDALKHALFNRNTLENGDNEIMIEVIQIRNGSLVVTYRIHWSPKYNSAPTENLLTASSLKTNLNNYLNDNSRMISVYHVAEEELPTTQVLDLCKINNYDCEYKCEFDDSTLDFMCVCPQGQIVDMTAPKRCMSLLDNTLHMLPETTTQKENNVLTSNFKENVSNTNFEEKVNTESVRLANKNSVFDWKEPHRDTPETTTETEPDLNFSHIFGPETPKPEPEPNAEPEGIPLPEPTLYPEPKDESDSITEPKSEPEPKAGPQTEPTPESSAEPNLEQEAAPEPTSEPKPEPEPTAEPTADSKLELETANGPIVEPKPEPEPAPEHTAQAKSDPEPTAEPNPEPEPSSLPNSEPQKNAVPEPASSTETLQEPESISTQQPEDETSKESQLADVTSASPEISVTSETSISLKDLPLFNAEQGTTRDELNTIKPTVMFDHPTFDLDGIIGLHTTAEPESYQDNENDLRIKPLQNNENGNEDKEKVITTTMRISISEPHVINEPSYEAKPEIISILREDGQRMNVTSIDPRNYTTIENDWLEADDENNNMGSVTTTRNFNEQMDTEMHDEGSSEHVNRPEQRSSKKFEDFTFKSTINSMADNNNEDITFDLIKGNNEMPPTLTTTEPTTESTEDMSVEVTSSINKIETTTMFTNKMNSPTENDVKETIEENKTETTTSNQNEPASSSEYLLNRQYEGGELMEVININNTSYNNIFNVTSTEKESTEKTMDVTYDNMLYNRSSKSIEKEASKNKELTESNEVLTNESEETTTDSDWLLETVTEVNYENIMNKMQKQETTETSKTKIDEIMSSGVTKDDFEPDYLSNIGTKTTKMSDQDEPLYGMTQDYDNEDPRVKRVNMDKDKAEINSKENNNGTSNQDSTSATNLRTETEFETTTIGQYIYKVSTQNMNDSVQNSESSLSIPMPAPGWEESDLSVKELPKQSVDENNQQVDVTSITSTTLPIIIVSNNQLNQDNSTRMDDLMLLNTTQVNNLNVTIYEISSHSRNQSMSSTNSPSTEFIDHEPEMNPFLPEVENNKSLVKKLQEGHDLEPTNFNETQNENVEEHNPSIVDILSSIDSKQTAESIENNKTNATFVMTESETTTAAVVDDDYLFNQLFTNSHEQESEITTEINKMLTSPPISYKDKIVTTEINDTEVLPISTFLLDTDDLDTTNKPSTLTGNDLNTSLSNDQMTANPVKENDSEFLSVVPIVPENLQPLKKDYNSETIQELNYISDSPKKSDRRTTNESNLNSINNVA